MCYLCQQELHWVLWGISIPLKFNLKKLLLLEFRSSVQQRRYLQNIQVQKTSCEQAANKVRQKSQNVSLIPINWQHTLSLRTNSNAGSNFPRILSKRIKKPANLTKHKKVSQIKTDPEKKVQMEDHAVPKVRNI